MKYLLYISFFCTLSLMASGQAASNSSLFIFNDMNTRTISLGGQKCLNEVNLLKTGQRIYLQYNLSPWMPNIDSDGKHWLHQVEAAVRLHQRHAVKAGWRQVSLDPIVLTDENGRLVKRLNPKGMEFQLGYSFAWLKALTLGITTNYYRYDDGLKVSEHVALTTSASYYHPAETTPYFYQFALEIANIGKKHLPLRFSYGASGGRSWQEKHQLLFNVGISHQKLLQDYAHILHAGIEYAYRNHLFLRTGYRSPHKGQGVYGYTSIGAGIHFFGADRTASQIGRAHV